ncbi:MAG: radical SAM protein [bacterium]|nr:radical SAM protein [bacterium]
MAKVTKDRTELFNRLFSIPNNWNDILYIHTPFCVRKCFYCVYSSKEPCDQDELDRFYNKVLPEQIEWYRPTLEKVKFHQVYFGGGTPSIGDAKTLERTFESIPGFKEIPVKLTESAPFTLTPEHLELYAKYRFSYVSMGVQTLSSKLLAAQNRLPVEKETLIEYCNFFEKADIIANIDLIFYLETGTQADLVQNRKELVEVMTDIRPASITIHSSYMAEKSVEKQLAMIRLMREVLAELPEYRCTNALLEDEEAELDMDNAAEYRFMRRDFDFHYYMSPKIPESHRYGHNMIALGAYEKFKPRYNYYYILDYMDKYTFKALMKKYEFIADEFKQTREKLGLPYDKYIPAKDFFKSEEDAEEFKKIIKEARLKYHKI